MRSIAVLSFASSSDLAALIFRRFLRSTSSDTGVTISWVLEDSTSLTEYLQKGKHWARIKSNWSRRTHVLSWVTRTALVLPAPRSSKALANDSNMSTRVKYKIWKCTRALARLPVRATACVKKLLQTKQQTRKEGSSTTRMCFFRPRIKPGEACRPSQRCEIRPVARQGGTAAPFLRRRPSARALNTEKRRDVKHLNWIFSG